MKRARMPTAGVAAGGFPLAMPSRFVTPLVPDVPVKIATPNGLAWVNPKCPGRAVMLKMEGDEAPEGVAVRRDQRKVTVSTVEEARVVPLAAVKAVTWRATVWPRCRALVSTAFAKAPKLLANWEATGRPLESIKNGFGLLARFTIKGVPIPKLPIKEPC